MGEWGSTEKDMFLSLSWFQCLTFLLWNISVYLNGVTGCSVVPCTFELLAYFCCTSLEFLDLGSPHMSSKCCGNAVGCPVSPKAEDSTPLRNGHYKVKCVCVDYVTDECKQPHHFASHLGCFPLFSSTGRVAFLPSGRKLQVARRAEEQLGSVKAMATMRPAKPVLGG